MAQQAHAQTAEPSAKLRPSIDLSPPAKPAGNSRELIFLSGDHVQGRPELETVVEGNAELRKRSLVIKADRLEYGQPEDLVKARGKVRILHEGDLFTGTELDLKVEAFQGHFLNPGYSFLRNGGHGRAQRIDFLDDRRSIARDATFSTCKDPGNVANWVPDWILKAAKIRFDFDEEAGHAENVQLRFKDVPLLSLSNLEFPLTDKRKSGVLPPSINLDSVSGFETTLPYYWNIAPNRDLTLYPTLKTKRGLQLGTEFRYLDPTYSGEARLDILPDDRLRQQSRWGYSAQHKATLGLTGPQNNPVSLQMNLNRVSDNNYWRDFPRGTASLTQRLLINDVDAHWQSGPWQARMRTIKWQTLQDSTAPITTPYDKLPGLNLRYQQAWRGLDLGFESDITRFASDPLSTNQPNAQRIYTHGQMAYPLRTMGGYVIPKLQVHSTHYSFNPYVNSQGITTAGSRATSSVPTYSIDAGLVFERPITFAGQGLMQTLEPRVMWAKTPYKYQQYLPVYDTAAKDFNFSSIWTENEYVGHDRISATHTLTLGATSRFLTSDTGQELVRTSVAQRLRYADQTVTLPGETPATATWSDLLLGVGINWSPKWQFDSTLQYSPEFNRSVRTTMTARYQPSNYRVISAAYRLKEGSSEQVDVGWQWPLDDLWRKAGDDKSIPGMGLGDGRLYTVGRINYSMLDRKMVDSVFGIEYDSGCWLTRVVIERIKNSNSTAVNRIMLQLELTGFSRLGTNPTGMLKSHIPGYQFLREKTLASPNRFTTYE